MMVEFLSSDDFDLGPALFAELLKRFHAIPEQSDAVLRKILSGAKHNNVLTAVNLESMLSELLAPMDRRQVFEHLRNPKSKAKPDTVEKMFEDFVAFIDSVVGNFLPWLLRGLQGISAHGSKTAAEVEWAKLAREIETRLSAVGGSPEINESLEPTE